MNENAGFGDCVSGFNEKAGLIAGPSKSLEFLSLSLSFEMLNSVVSGLPKEKDGFLSSASPKLKDRF